MRFGWNVPVVFWLTLSSAVWAAEDLTVSPALVDPSLIESASEPYPEGILSLGSELVLYQGELSRKYQASALGWGINAGFLKQIGSSSVYWGGDFGTDFWGFPPPGSTQPGSSRNALSIRTMLTLVYRFLQFSTQQFRPYFGASLGPDLYIVRTSALSPSQSGTTEAQFLIGALVRPGVEWAFSKSFGLNFETRLGFLGWDFLFQPQLALSVAL